MEGNKSASAAPSGAVDAEPRNQNNGSPPQIHPAILDEILRVVGNKYDPRLADCDKKLGAHDTTFADHATRIANLEKELRETKALLQLKTQELSESEKMRINLDKEVKVLRNEINEGRLKSLESQENFKELEKKFQAMKEKDNKPAELEEKIFNLEKSKEHFMKKCEKLRSKLEEEREHKRRLEDELRAIKSDRSELSNNLDECQHQKVEVSMKLEELRERHDRLMSEYLQSFGEDRLEGEDQVVEVCHPQRVLTTVSRPTKLQ